MDGDKTITYFVPSPPMSTYFVAFLVSDFECLGSNMDLLNGSRIPISVCTRPSFKDKVKFALHVAVDAMKYYLETFQIDYPLPKLGKAKGIYKNEFHAASVGVNGG